MHGINIKIMQTEELPRGQEAPLIITLPALEIRARRHVISWFPCLYWRYNLMLSVTEFVVSGWSRRVRERERTGVGLIELSALTVSKWSVNVSQLSDLFCMSAPLASRNLRKRAKIICVMQSVLSVFLKPVFVSCLADWCTINPCC